MIRSSGSGRSSIAFINESGLALIIDSQRLRWRLPKIIFFLNRYVICPLISCVPSNPCAQITNKPEWQVERHPWVLATLRITRRSLTILIAGFIFPLSISVRFLAHIQFCSWTCYFVLVVRLIFCFSLLNRESYVPYFQLQVSIWPGTWVGWCQLLNEYFW